MKTQNNSSKPRNGYLYTTGKKKLWQLQYDVLGQRTRISLRTSDPKEAESRAQEILGRIKLLSTRQEYLQALVKMGEEAESELIGLSLSAKRRLRIHDSFNAYKRCSRRPRKANDESLGRYRAYNFDIIDVIGDKYMDDVHESDAEVVMEYLEKSNSASTVTMKLNWFKLLWNTLQVTPNPWEGLRTTKKGDAKPWRRFTHEECVRIYEAAGRYKRLILCGYYTGQRLKDCITICNDFHLIEGQEKPWVEIGQAKTGKMVTIPIVSELRTSNFHFTEYDPAKASRRIKKIMADVGIKENGSKVGFHSFRKTFVSMMDEAGAPVFVTNSITGHDAGGMHARYSQTDVESARFWMEKSLKSLTE